MKKKLVSVTAKDCRWDYYRGKGNGGQKKNKTENCARCTHPPSGAVGKSEEGKSKEQNKKRAFQRMAQSEEFKQWLKIECSRATGELAAIEQRVKDAMHPKNIRVEGKDEKGCWKELNENQET